MSNETMSADASQSEKIDHELEVLRHLAHAEHVRQRDIARIIGMSLGMTNVIVKRLAKKGLITIRKVNNRNIMYAVSPDGLEVIARRSYRYFRRTIKNVVTYRNTIDSLVHLIRNEGFDEICVVDESDLDFIVEHACELEGLNFSRRKTRDAGNIAGDSVFLLQSEKHEPPSGRRSLQEVEAAILHGEREAYLSEVLI